jgi:hypothetical protein
MVTPSIDTDLAGISTSKYPDHFTIELDELRASSSSNDFRFGAQDSRPDNASAYSRFNPASVQYQVPVRPAEVYTMQRTTRTRYQTNSASEPRAPLNILADTALASPSTSGLRSRHAYSSGISSNSAASPEKSLTSDDQKSTGTTRLSNLLKAFMKEFGTATDDQRVSLFRAIQEASEESANGHQSDENMHLPSPHTARSPLSDGRTNAYDSGADGKSDSASEQDELRKGLEMIINGLKDPQSFRDRRKAKNLAGSNTCTWPNCNKGFPQRCQLRLVNQS